jgi:ribonuclease I
MQKEWPTLYGGDPTSFWCHEWCKHGTCAVAAGLPSINSPTAYFETALDLFEKLDIDNSLKRSGIDHSSSSTYELNQFFSVFSVKPTFECQKSGDGQILFQARFCYDTNMQPADCQMDWFASIESCDDNLPIYYN